MELTKKNAQLLLRRDLINFVRLRTGHPGDDLSIGDLLVESFKETYAKKLPTVITNHEREIELRNVASRRQNGVVRIIELGFQIIGTYSLLSPNSPLDESWTPNTCTLRCVAIAPQFHSLQLSEKLVADAIDVAKHWRADHICLHVQSGADGVARLYEKFGFRRAPEGDKLALGNQIEGYLLNLAEAQ